MAAPAHRPKASSKLAPSERRETEFEARDKIFMDEAFGTAWT